LFENRQEVEGDGGNKEVISDLPSPPSLLSPPMQTWKQRARQLKEETYAIYIACKDSRVPWYARVFAGIVVAYALSPIDLIPDVIPVLGYLKDPSSLRLWHVSLNCYSAD